MGIRQHASAAPSTGSAFAAGLDGGGIVRPLYQVPDVRTWMCRGRLHVCGVCDVGTQLYVCRYVGRWSVDAHVEGCRGPMRGVLGPHGEDFFL